MALVESFWGSNNPDLNVLSLASDENTDAKTIFNGRIPVREASGNGLLNAARLLVAEGYRPLSTPLLTPQEVYEDLCRDGYDAPGRSSTLVTLNPQDQTQVTGTLRYVPAGDGKDGLPIIETMGLMDVDWPHRAKGIPDSLIGELGRFTVNKAYRESKVEINRVLVKSAMSKAQEQGVRTLYAVMPGFVNQITTSAGLPFVLVENARLKEEEPGAKKLFDRYSRYWRGARPQLYQINLG